MTVPKILGLVRRCGECPRYRYYSGGAHTCTEADQIVDDPDRIAPFCPLADFPSRVIKEMQITVTGLQQAVDYSFAFAMLTFVAAKLKRNLNVNGSAIRIPLRDGDQVTLFYPYISKIDLSPLAIWFTDGDKRYKLDPESGVRGVLYEVVRREGIDEDLFHQLDIAP